MNPHSVNIESSWKKVLHNEFAKPYFADIKRALLDDKKSGKTIYPPGKLIFKAFDKTPFDKVKVVIIGQDPYHSPGEAMGLCFSVPKGVRTPPSLINIYKEIKTDIGHEIASHGDLISWAESGVLMLNAMLTVRHKEAGSHRKIGWQIFTDAVIKCVSDHKENVIFLLWGKFAQQKVGLIDQLKHHVLMAAHPSPLARGAFFGCKHFSKANEILKSQGIEPINWRIE